MKCHIFFILFLILESECSPDDGFFISAPGVFHVGVNEKVFVQMGKSHLNYPVTLYLEREIGNIVVSAKKTVVCAGERETKTVELMIDREMMSRLPQRQERIYLNLVAESRSFGDRKQTRVLVSNRRGNIFIQTDQPMYSPGQTVKYRIFTLDHTFRPHEEVFQISVVNAAGNRVMRSLKTASGGIFKGVFPIPDIAKMGTWKITAHYEDDEANAASREFKVQKFVLPTFEVNVAMRENYILLNAEQFHFTISAMYSYGEKVKGAYHCQFGVVEKGSRNTKPVFIKGLELTGSVQDGTAEASLQMEDLKLRLQDQKIQTLSELQQKGSRLYLRVFVTNIESGELQEAEVYLPLISHKYTLDLSRTRSHFLPGYPLDVAVVARLPDGSPAAGVLVQINVPASSEKSWKGTTDQEGAVFPVFNIPTPAQITVEVSAEGSQQRKVLQPTSSQSNSYLYLSFTNKIYSVGDLLTVNYNTIKAQERGFIYYMVLSRGVLVKKGSLTMGTLVRDNLQITADMVPSFRLIGYCYDRNGNIIADSVWVDVRDECEINVKVEQKGPFLPGRQSELQVDLHGQKARVALLAVDKAFYGLHADNKLTAKQVFSTMQSYDLGCSYSGGSDPASVLTDAGLSFVSRSQSDYKRNLGCHSQPARQRRSVDLQQEMMALKSNFSDEKLQECCAHGFSLIPMRLTCKERAQRVSRVATAPLCAETFLSCCLEGERLRQKKIEEDAQKELGRTASIDDIEQFFMDTAAQYIRRFFPPSFSFIEFDVNDKGRHFLFLPDSITTWEVQLVTLSPATGFCVVKPSEVRAFKNIFVSLRLPYSVRKYEQISISPVIYNYGFDPLQVAVHMEQTEGLCSPGSATTTAFVNITVEPQSSKVVSFSAVPMVIGSIPIKIRLYDMESEVGIDAVEKTLKVLTEGLEKRVEETKVFKLDGKSTKNFIIDGSLPSDTIPDSSSSIFISAEGDGFGSSHAKNLLSPAKVANLIVLPTGCLEQTMTKLAPTASAIRYLDLSEQWFDLPPGSRDGALDNLEKGYIRILGKEHPNGAYGPWRSVPYSNWMTALVVKVLSMVAERQTVAFGQQGRRARLVPLEEIRNSVRYLLSVEKTDGSFGDPNPVLHRQIMEDADRRASMTAFITLALKRSLPFLDTEGRNNAEASISRSTTYLQSSLKDLQHPYAVAITAYCLSACLPKGTDHSSTWTKLQALATEGENGCHLWTTDPSPQNQKMSNTITVDATAYALLTAVELGHTSSADKIACWLTTQENYFGGFKSSQDTMMALEALAEYELKRDTSPDANLIAEFRVSGKTEILKLALEKKKDKVETDLKIFSGNNILAELTGTGNVKLKIVKAYHLLDPKDDCDQVSISVTVEGKVKYTAKIIETYEYYDDYSNNEETETRVPRSAIEWFDARTRNRRDLENKLDVGEGVTYRVCVSHSLNRNLSGMAIADITLLSGFEAVTEDLDKLKAGPEQYITHYEVSHGRVVIYFNELFESEECIKFDAIQRVPIGLLQPAPAVFYDYYEPSKKCTVFYSAPQRSKVVSKLCSEDVCQCAERPCHKIRNTFQLQRGRRVTKSDRLQHACFFPVVDYAYVVEVFNVSMKSNFELYKMNVKEVLRSHGDILVRESSVRVFAKRRQCKGQLDLGKQYLIMGKDGSTTDSHGMMQYLLESNTWVEREPSPEECKKSAHRLACKEFIAFADEYKIDGCRQ
ncbi:complement C4-B [Chelmon rostratus]|uniref:complement C4-B n=1 Tax=Chelmon rostratus TaxID=109905 RepID=UPI001BEA4784|nr:complement C4-B [Chelmon rostratus]